MNEEIKYALEKFRQAFDRLKEGTGAAQEELEKDGVIQRFEFTFELLWKTLKIILENEGVLCQTPRNCFKEAFRIGLIQDEQAFLLMLEDRNLTSHIYDQAASEQIFKRIQDLHLPALEKLLRKLQELN